jgi:hypothetical protein
MGRRNVIKAFQALSAQMDGDTTGEETTIEQLDRATYFVAWANGVANDGEFIVEATQDGETWSELPFAPPLVVDTASGGAIIQINDMAFLKIRPKFKDNSAGVGAGDIMATIKAVNGGA